MPFSTTKNFLNVVGLSPNSSKKARWEKIRFGLFVYSITFNMMPQVRIQFEFSSLTLSALIYH
jgi:hypothetical protein